MARRGMPAFMLLLMALVLAVSGCGNGGPAADTATTGSTIAVPPSTESTQPPASDSTGSTAGTTSTDTGGSATNPDPSALLTDEDAAEYFGVPARHEGPSTLGNVTYTPADGTGQMIIITTQPRDTLENFEAQVRIENEVLGEEPQKIEGLGESAYYTISSVRFFKNGGTYQVTASNPTNGDDLMTALTALARKMAARVP